MLIVHAVVSAVANLLILAAIPFLGYFVYHKWCRQRGFREIARRAGLQQGERRYIGYSLAVTVVLLAGLVIWSPALEPFIREGSAQQAFLGLGFSGTVVIMALLYGVIKTGFSEELLFRGLIAGSLSRRMPLVWANVVQSLIFLLPHLLLLFIMPELWGILPLIFVVSLFKGWVRIKSGSIVGPWLIHGALNVAMCLYVAIGTAGA